MSTQKLSGTNVGGTGSVDMKMQRIMEQTPVSSNLVAQTPSVNKTHVSEEQLITKLKKLMKMNLKNFCYQDAIFFADKILHLQQYSTDKFVKAVYDLAHCYMLNKEYLRCVQLIEKFELAFHDERFRILTAQALFNSGNINACINVLEKDLIQENEMLQGGGNISVSCITDTFHGSQKEDYFKGLRYLLLAKSYEAQENKTYSIQFYKDALRSNAENFEAFNRLISNYLLTGAEKEQLITELKFTPENLWLKDYYISRINQQMRDRDSLEGVMAINAHLNTTSIQNNIGDESGISPSRFQPADYLDNEDPNDTLRNPGRSDALSPPQLQQQNLQAQSHGLHHPGQSQEVKIVELLCQNESFDFKQIEAERLFNDQNYVKAYEVIKSVIDQDFYFVSIVPLYCSVLIELGKTGELYYLAHKLVSANPDSAVSWFAVGSYYFLIKKYDLARKYFNKANRTDKNFAASWIAFGHAFAAQDESDQAMAAYRTAARLFPGCHQAPLFIGMEYLRTNNLKTALLSFNEAQKICETDPLVFNEIGTVYYKQKEFDTAKQYFAKALSLCNEYNSRTYETILMNLAHCHRKQKDLESAIQSYERCLTINPKNPATYTALGFSYHLKGEFREALNCYHKANFLKHEDPLTEEMIQRALHDLNEFAIDKTYLKY